MKPNIGITDKNLAGIIDILNTCLANANILYIKTRKFHWNVNGNNFMELHKLFETHYETMANAIDEIAERVSQLGGIAIGTSIEFAQKSSLKETPAKNPNYANMLKELLQDHEIIIKALRKAISEVDEKLKDAVTADFLTELMANHEKMAWTIRRYFK